MSERRSSQRATNQPEVRGRDPHLSHIRPPATVTREGANRHPAAAAGATHARHVPSACTTSHSPPPAPPPVSVLSPSPSPSMPPRRLGTGPCTAEWRTSTPAPSQLLRSCTQLARRPYRRPLPPHMQARHPTWRHSHLRRAWMPRERPGALGGPGWWVRVRWVAMRWHPEAAADGAAADLCLRGGEGRAVSKSKRRCGGISHPPPHFTKRRGLAHQTSIQCSRQEVARPGMRSQRESRRGFCNPQAQETRGILGLQAAHPLYPLCYCGSPGQYF